MILSRFQFEFRIDIFVFVVFLSGILMGLLLFGLLYLYSCIRSLRKQKVTLSKEIDAVTEDQIKRMIELAQEDFLENRKSELGAGIAMKNSVFGLVNDIAALYYPKSKKPLAELTMAELIHLNRYILEKVEEILDHRGLRMLKNIRLVTILNLMDTQAKVVNSKPMQVSKKFHLDKLIKSGTIVFNAINPFYWFKRLVVSPSISLITKKLFLLVIGIAGEETYRVYSKRVFLEEDEELKKLLQSVMEEEEEVLAEPKKKMLEKKETKS